MASIVGIDLGGTDALVSTIRKGAVETILNEASKRKTPTLVSFYNGQRYLGEPALSLESSNAKNTIRDIKRLIGKTWSDPEMQQEIARLPNKDRFKQGPNDSVLIEVTHEGETLALDPKSVLAMTLAGLKRTSEAVTRESHGTGLVMRDVVISVPPYFTDAHRRCVLDAAKIADLNCLKLMNDSSAVALDYGMWRNARGQFDDTKPSVVMFVDVGYSDSWVSIVSFVKGKATVLSVAWDRNLGGRDVEASLVEMFAKEFEAKTKLNCRTEVKSMLKLNKAAEKAKQVLTPEGTTKAEVFVEYLMNETDFKAMLSVEQLDAVVEPIAARLEPLVVRALADAKLTTEDVPTVEMVGGSTRMRQFKKAVCRIMNLDVSKVPAANYGVLTTLNSDESVCRGCTLMCAMLSPQFKIQATLDIIELVPLPVKLHWEQPASAVSAAADTVEEGEDKPAAGNQLALLKRTDETPKTRRVTFRRNEQFDITAEYDEVEEFLLPKHAPKLLSTFKIGVPPSQNGQTKAKIAVHFHHDKSGVFGVSSAQLQNEEVVMPPTPEVEGSDKLKKKVIKTELVVETKNRWTWQGEEFTKYATLEHELAAKDKLLRDTSDKRNELEEFVYSTRSSLDGELSKFSTAEEKKKLLEKLQEEQTWLEDVDDDEVTLPVLITRLAGLRKLFDVIQSRSNEVEARQEATNRFNTLTQTYLAVLNSVSPDHAHITEEERKRAKLVIEEQTNTLRKEQEKQGKQMLNSNPTLTAAMIDEKTNVVRTECRATVDKPKPKPKTPTPTPTPPPAANAAEEEAKKSSEEGDKMDVEGEEKKTEPPAPEELD
ncbi:hypothetical protein BASA81_000068 [Batrachochytrium salamandrivorans]|nr:hypothetical protein BASA81_000068 [Batrachochytrium salamandrivorans]